MENNRGLIHPSPLLQLGRYNPCYFPLPGAALQLPSPLSFVPKRSLMSGWNGIAQGQQWHQQGTCLFCLPTLLTTCVCFILYHAHTLATTMDSMRIFLGVNYWMHDWEEMSTLGIDALNWSTLQKYKTLWSHPNSSQSHKNFTPFPFSVTTML